MKKDIEQKNPSASKKIKIFSGKVASDKMKDTVVVLVESYKKHPIYGKYIKRQKRFKAHDAGNKHKVGDVVNIRETRPMSKNKRFTVI